MEANDIKTARERLKKQMDLQVGLICVGRNPKPLVPYFADLIKVDQYLEAKLKEVKPAKVVTKADDK